jgi:hypothetical protein
MEDWLSEDLAEGDQTYLYLPQKLLGEMLLYQPNLLCR